MAPFFEHKVKKVAEPVCLDAWAYSGEGEGREGMP